MYFKKSNTPITLQLFTLTWMWIGPRTKLNNEVISRPNINCIVSLSSSFRITTRADAAFLKDNYQCLVLSVLEEIQTSRRPNGQQITDENNFDIYIINFC